jgi:hypothetical protein
MIRHPATATLMRRPLVWRSGRLCQGKPETCGGEVAGMLVCRGYPTAHHAQYVIDMLL